MQHTQISEGGYAARIFATHCNTPRTATHHALQHTAAHLNVKRWIHCEDLCNALQHTATHYNTLQHAATHCNKLQHTATHCNTLKSQEVETLRGSLQALELQCLDLQEQVQHTATTLCNALQHTTPCCNTLQRAATHRNALQHNATHCNNLEKQFVLALPR